MWWHDFYGLCLGIPLGWALTRFTDWKRGKGMSQDDVANMIAGHDDKLREIRREQVKRMSPS
jgi:hypothetical protein